MPKPFRIYRIICTLTDKALVGGSDHATWAGPWNRPDQHAWHERGTWSASGGAFWKGEQAVRRHLQNLCHDWVNRNAPSRWPRYEGQRDYWTEVVPGSADWSRLAHLRVEQIYISNYATTTLLASDFMGIPDERAA
jgi:hypothetical protein